MADMELKEYTADEVFKHTTQDDCWLVIGNASNGKFALLAWCWSHFTLEPSGSLYVERTYHSYIRGRKNDDDNDHVNTTL